MCAYVCVVNTRLSSTIFAGLLSFSPPPPCCERLVSWSMGEYLRLWPVKDVRLRIVISSDEEREDGVESKLGTGRERERQSQTDKLDRQGNRLKLSESAVINPFQTQIFR